MMPDVYFYGIFAAFVFIALLAIGAIVFVTALIISITQKATNARPITQQFAFGYVVASLIPVLTGLVFLYISVSLKNKEVLKAFDDYISFIVMVLAFATMMIIGRRWRKRITPLLRTDQQYPD
jgi:protein-S-isoprenylcysteine O-methyltransferase Ste14